MAININLNISMPKSWNELSPLQFKEIAFALDHYHKFIDCHPKDTHDYYNFKLYTRLVKNLIRHNNFFKTWITLRQVPPEEYQKEVQFLIKDVARTKFLEAFEINGTKFYPPLDRLQNISIKEFSFADAMFYNWRKTKDDRYLDLLCATLYRRAAYKYMLLRTPKDDLDIRKKFNKILVEQDVSYFKKLDPKLKVAIAFTYEGCRNYIAKLYPHVFPAPAVRDPEDKTPKRDPIYTPFGKLIMHKIKFDPSKLDTTQELNANEFLSNYENELIHEANSK